MSTEIAKINDEQFGKLIELPNLYTAAKASVSKATAFTEKIMQPWKAIADLKKADLTEVEKIMEPIRVLRVKLAETIKKLNADRSPHTEKMHAIVSLFVAEEKSVESLFEQTKKAEDDLQAEYLRRKKDKENKAAKDLKDKQDKIDRVANIKQQINAWFGTLMTSKIVAIHEKFYSFADATPLKAWIDAMRSWTPAFAGINTEGISGIAEEIIDAANTLLPTFTEEYVRRLRVERDNMVDMLAGRLLELEKNPVAKTVDVSEFASTVMSTVSAMNEAAQSDASKDKIDAAFDVTDSIGANSPGAKGAKVKKKYKVESLEAMQAIMQSWVRYNMNLLSIDELNTKLSFMRTAADVRLNEGHPHLEAKGLSIVDDIRTRTNKPTTNA